MKRLRRQFPQKIKFFHCGEYGENLERPHYHAILFNLDFPDKKLFQIKKDIRLYTSELLDKLWPFGFSTIGDVTFESAAYVARYCLKKINGDQAKHHYEKLNIETGEFHSIQPEYITMSLKPAIAKDWFQKYKADVFPSDEVSLRGLTLKPPKYYDRLYDAIEPKKMLKIKGNRIKESKKHKNDSTPPRLAARLQVKTAQLNLLKRSIDI